MLDIHDGNVTVSTFDLTQVVGLGALKLAKQAMRKRDQYQDRRG